MPPKIWTAKTKTENSGEPTTSTTKPAAKRPAATKMVGGKHFHTHFLTHTLCWQAATKKSLWDMGLQIFRTHLSRRPEVARKAVQGLLALIDSERSGDQVRPPPCPRRTIASTEPAATPA